MLLKSITERDEECVLDWVLHKLMEFGPFLGLSYEGFEVEIMELFKSIEHRRRYEEREVDLRSTSGKRLINELKKLESSVNRKGGGLSQGCVCRGKGIVIK